MRCEFISLQQCHTYITSRFTQVLALLRPVNPSRRLRRPQRHAPTTPLPLPKRRAQFMQVTALHPLPKSTGPYLAVLPHPPSCSTILTAAPPPSSTYPHGGNLPPRHLVFHFPTTSRLPQALPLMHHCYTETNVPLPPRHLVFHFPTTSSLPQALPLRHVRIKVPLP